MMGSHICGIFGVRKYSVSRVLKMGRVAVKRLLTSKVSAVV